MRICFIGDASSIHVQRIVSYHVRKHDEILVLSSAQRKCFIEGATIRHLAVTSGRPPAGSGTKGGNSKGSIAGLKRFVPRGWKIFVKRMVRNVRLFRKRRYCRAEIERFDADVIYCFRSFPEGALALSCHTRPLLLRTAGPDISKLPKYPVYRQIIRKVLRAVDLLVTESRWEKDLLRRLCGREIRSEVIIIGVDSDQFRPQLKRERLRDRYGLPRNAFIVVTNRYLNGHYNGWLVVKALQAILAQCPDLILLYLTPSPMDGRSKAKAEATTKQFPQIRFVEGPLAHAEVPAILGCGDVYVSFSSYDGVPNSLLEAMACGLVPVVAELPQLHEWIERGRTGYMVPQYDVKALGAVIGDLYGRRTALGEISSRCIEKIRDQGSHDACMERTRALLMRLAMPCERAAKPYHSACGQNG